MSDDFTSESGKGYDYGNDSMVSGKRIETTRGTHPETVTHTVPAGGCLRLRYEEA